VVSATYASPDPPLLLFIEDCLRIFDRHPRIVGDQVDGGGDRRVHPGGDGEPGPSGQRRGDDAVSVER